MNSKSIVLSATLLGLLLACSDGGSGAGNSGAGGSGGPGGGGGSPSGGASGQGGTSFDGGTGGDDGGAGTGGTPDSGVTPDPSGIYISPGGDDANPGTADHPIRTLEHARDLVRTINQAMDADIHVYLEDGTFVLSAPLTLGAEDSGTQGHDVIYAAAPGALPVVSGGLPVAGWKVVDAGKNLWSAPAPDGLVNTRQLYVDGVRALRARGVLPVTLTGTATGYTASAATMATWKNPGDIELVYTGGNALWSEGSYGLGPWTEPRCPIESIQGTTITMAQPCWDNSTKRVSFPPTMFAGRTVNLVGPASVGDRPEFVENAFELLGTPGQWYLDRAARVIYYVPRPGEDLTKADVEAPVLETLISGQGTEGKPIHNIVFSGLQFSYATWLVPSGKEGFSEIQANYTLTGQGANQTQALCDISADVKGTCPFGAWTRTPGNVTFAYDTAIQFVNDAFVHLGAAGLELGNGTEAALVKGCIFTDISGNGVELGGVDLVEPSQGQVTKDNRVQDNHLYDLPVEYHGGVAILTGYAQTTIVSNNQIDHTAYSGISMGWGGWPDKIMKPAQANPSHDNQVSFNLITDHMQLLADGGGIYTQGLTGSSLANGERVEGNVIRGQRGSGHEIYSDNGSTFMTIVGNVLLDCNFDNWGAAHKDYSTGGTTNDPLDIEGNYWQQGDPKTPPAGLVMKGNHLVGNVTQVPAAIVAKAGLEADYHAILDKRFGAPAAPEPPMRVAAFGGDAFAYVSFNPPVFEGSSSVATYTVTSSKGDMATITAADFANSSYVKVLGLTNGTAYTFTVTATNGDGTSSSSLPSGPVTPSVATVTVPGAPQAVSAIPGNGTASVHFKQSLTDGGSPILSYTITSNPGNRSVTVGGAKALTLGTTHTTFDVVDGLSNGTPYTFTVVANNAAGASPAAVTAAVTPAP
jgi:Fibronectin type III domain/Right handed beta helix region